MSARGFGSGKIVGAPTFPKCKVGTHTCRIPVAQAFRPEASSPGATVAPGTEILSRGGVVTAATKTLTPESGELQKLRHWPRAGIMLGLPGNVGAPTFPNWNVDLADAHAHRTPVAEAFRPEVFSRDGMVAPRTRILTPKRGELQIPESKLPLGRSTPKVGLSKNVGATTFLELPRAVRP
jgi:hypothetical protein